jgi:GNAT superfamily N-acetyltransferase
MGSYHNYSIHIAQGYWARRSFLHHWWNIYAEDRRWTPPLYTWCYDALVRNTEPHIARCQPCLIHLEAAVRRSLTGIGYGGPIGLTFDERCVAACVILVDPRRSDGTAHLAMLHCVNDEEALERLVAAAWEQAAEHGVVRLLGPTGLASCCGAGLLLDHFNLMPPLHTPYNPPYLPEMFESLLAPYLTTRLYELSVANKTQHDSIDDRWKDAVSCEITPFQPHRLATDLLSLVQGVYEEDDFPTPDAVEMDFILRSWQVAPLMGWLAHVGEQPVGFILFQADCSRALRRARGGRSYWRRWWLRTRRRSSVAAGRVLLGGVAPEWRGMGLGRALLRRTLAGAREFGWRTLTIGPVVSSGATAAFLKAFAATPLQTYAVYSDEPDGRGRVDDSWTF